MMFITQAYSGLSEPWRYIVGIIAVFVGWQIIGTFPLLGAVVIQADSLSVLGAGDLSAMADLLGRNLFFFLILLSFAIGLISLFAFVKFVHQQSIRALTTSRRKVDWRRITLAFTLWAVVSTVFMCIDFALAPDDYVFNFKPIPFLILTIIAVIMVPIQTSLEEYLMRGYLMQGLGIMAKNRWLPLFVTSLIFGVLHIFNPEVGKLGYGILIYYIGTGFFLGIITLMDEGLELALGFHAANNLVASLLVTADWTAFQTESLFLDVSDPTLDWTVLVPVIVVYPILLLIFARKYKWTNWKERLTGKIPSKESFLAQFESDTTDYPSSEIEPGAN